MACCKGGGYMLRRVLVKHPELSIPGTKFFKALPGFDGIEHGFEGKTYKFFENKAVEAPASFIMHENTIVEVEPTVKAEPKVEAEVTAEPKNKKNVEEVKDANHRF